MMGVWRGPDSSSKMRKMAIYDAEGQFHFEDNIERRNETTL